VSERMTAVWRTGRPPEHGYYLAAWTTPAGRVVVSELWFNPSSFGSGWWSSRGYLRQEHHLSKSETVPVAAWMPLPDPPGDTPNPS
jgi:hypothetical protein